MQHLLYVCSKFCMHASFIKQKPRTYLHDLQHFLSGNASISVLVIKFKWPAQLLHSWTFDQHADGHDILPEINHPILREATSIKLAVHLSTLTALIQFVSFSPHYYLACGISVLHTRLTPGRRFHRRNAFGTREEWSVHLDIHWWTF